MMVVSREEWWANRTCPCGLRYDRPVFYFPTMVALSLSLRGGSALVDVVTKALL